MSATLAKRPLGSTGLDVSVLGLGGFHQVEAAQDTIDAVVERYLAAGGTYVETAVGYGAGASETKLGRALDGNRDRVVLASKTAQRTEEGAWREINESLERLGTSYIDIHFFHNLMDGECARCREADGAMRAFARALDQGLIRHVGMSSHWPMLYLEAAEELPVEVVLIWGNYLDFCNFPEIPATILPKLRERGIGVLFMKPLADGFLFRSPRFALRYALAQDADCLVAGFNSVSMLEEDLHVCCDPEPVTEAEVETILREAQELGDYVCRQCPECSVTPGDGVLKRVFELEGKYDRQMDDLRPCDPAQYAMRERLKGWFQGGARAQQAYATLGQPAPRVAGGTLGTCRYGLDIQRKLRIAHAKLVASERPELL